MKSNLASDLKFRYIINPGLLLTIIIAGSIHKEGVKLNRIGAMGETVRKQFVTV